MTGTLENLHLCAPCSTLHMYKSAKECGARARRGFSFSFLLLSYVFSSSFLLFFSLDIFPVLLLAVAYKQFVSFNLNDVTRMDFSNRVVVLTGANSGLGYGALTLLLSPSSSSPPLEIFIGCRSAERCSKALEDARRETSNEKTKVTPLILDLESRASIDNFSEAIESSNVNRVDVVSKSQSPSLSLFLSFFPCSFLTSFSFLLPFLSC